MSAIPFDTRSSDPVDLALWNTLHSDTNAEQLSRLHRQLRQACARELTPRQQDFLQLYYRDGLSMTEIAARYSLHPSTVSRTLRRARERLRRVLQYAF